MKKLFLLCAIIFVAASCAKTEYNTFCTLHGEVSDSQSGEPVANVNVMLSPGGITKITGSDGRFEFKNIEPKQYSVTVQKSGYATNRKTIDALSGETIEVNITITKQ